MSESVKAESLELHPAFGTEDPALQYILLFGNKRQTTFAKHAARAAVVEMDAFFLVIWSVMGRAARPCNLRGPWEH